MRYLSVCSGMEAASVAWHPLGWTPVGFSEIEPFPCAILKHRFPNTPNYGSLTEYQSWPLEPGAIDLLVGGTPCQSFSVAGLRKGLADPRGNLALTFLGLADKLKPRWIVWENVPGVLSSGGGRDFGSFLGALVELGYGFAYRVLDAQYVGGPGAVPQRRRRVFVVACLGDWRAAAEVLSLREGLRGYLETGNKKRKGSAGDAGAGVEASGLPIWRAGDQANAEHMIDHAGTVNCNKGSHGGFIAQPVSHWEGGDVHPTLNQSAKGSGGVGSSNQELFSQGGAYLVPGQPTPFRKSKRACSTTDNETGVLANSSNTLNNFDLGDTRTTHAVVQPVAWTQNQREEVRLLGDKVGAIALPGTHQTNYIAEPVHQMPGSVAPTIGASGPPYSRTGNERVEAEALAVTTVMENSRRDAIRIYEGTSPTLQSFMGTGGCNVPMVQPAMAVRRLTPVECERLQGFPDNWSRISWKGKPEEQCPDGPRYKACGNSMAVPVMRWIGERIAAVDATLSPNA
jgi:DNA (cytosine-5)-methyltransferase 1